MPTGSWPVGYETDRRKQIVERMTEKRSAIRRAGRQRRRALAGPARASAERALVGHLQSLAALEAAMVGLFVADDGEPDLSAIVDRLWEAGQSVAVPVLEDDPTDFSMRFALWPPGETLIPGRFGIPVPRMCAEVTPDTLLVSLVAFDSVGNRMGRGGGFFDRFLSSYVGTVVGVGFESQRVAAVPVDAHDVAMPAIVTDLGVRYFATGDPSPRRGASASGQ